MAKHVVTTPAIEPGEPRNYRLGHHPRRTDNPALLNADGTLAHTFHIEATRIEIAGILQTQGLKLHADDTVTRDGAEGAPTRRGILSMCASAALAGTALATAAPDALATANPDAELIAICDRYCHLKEAYARTCWAEDGMDDRPGKPEALAEFRATEAALKGLDDRIVMATPATVEGHRAKARAVEACYGEKKGPAIDGAGTAIMWSIVCDLIGDDKAPAASRIARGGDASGEIYSDQISKQEAKR